MMDLELLSTKELADEILNRHTDAIIIIGDKKDETLLNICAKTGGGPGYELQEALGLLHDAGWHMTETILKQLEGKHE
jgi:hypothetical protein